MPRLVRRRKLEPLPPVSFTSTHMQQIPHEVIRHVFTTFDYSEQQSGVQTLSDCTQVCMDLCCMDALGQHEDRTCPIAMDDFDKARVDFLPEDACFIEGRPEFCVATLPCGHRFHSLSILCHVVLSCMRCPV